MGHSRGLRAGTRVSLLIKDRTSTGKSELMIPLVCLLATVQEEGPDSTFDLPSPLQVWVSSSLYLLSR